MITDFIESKDNIKLPKVEKAKKKSSKKILPISKTLSKKKKKGNKKVMKGGNYLALPATQQNSTYWNEGNLKRFANFYRQISRDGNNYIELVHSSHTPPTLNIYKIGGTTTPQEFYILGKNNTQLGFSGAIPTLHHQIAPQNAHCRNELRHIDSPFVFFTNLITTRAQFTTTTTEVKAPPKDNFVGEKVYINNYTPKKINTYKKITSPDLGDKYKNNVLIHKSYLLTTDELHHINNYTFRWDGFINNMLWDKRYWTPYGAAAYGGFADVFPSRKNYRMWYFTDPYYPTSCASCPWYKDTQTNRKVFVYTRKDTNTLDGGPWPLLGEYLHKPQMSPLGKVLRKKLHIWDKIFRCKANVTIQKDTTDGLPGSGVDGIANGLPAGYGIFKNREYREFTRIMNSDLGWKAKRGDHFQQLNYLSCVYGGYKNLVPVIIDFVGQGGHGRTEGKPLYVLHIQTVAGIPYVSFDKDPFFSRFNENEVLFNRGLVLCALGRWSAPKLLRGHKYGSMSEKWVRELHVVLKPDPGTYRLMHWLRYSSTEIAVSGKLTNESVIPGWMKRTEGAQSFLRAPFCFKIDTKPHLEDEERRLLYDNHTPYPLPVVSRIPGARPPVYLAGGDRAIDKPGSDIYNGAYFREYKGRRNAPTTNLHNIDYKAKWGALNGLNRGLPPNSPLTAYMPENRFIENFIDNGPTEPRLIDTTKPDGTPISSYIKGTIRDTTLQRKLQTYITTGAAPPPQPTGAAAAAPAPPQPQPQAAPTGLGLATAPASYPIPTGIEHQVAGQPSIAVLQPQLTAQATAAQQQAAAQATLVQQQALAQLQAPAAPPQAPVQPPAQAAAQQQAPAQPPTHAQYVEQFFKTKTPQLQYQILKNLQNINDIERIILLLDYGTLEELLKIMNPIHKKQAIMFVLQEKDFNKFQKILLANLIIPEIRKDIFDYANIVFPPAADSTPQNLKVQTPQGIKSVLYPPNYFTQSPALPAGTDGATVPAQPPVAPAQQTLPAQATQAQVLAIYKTELNTNSIKFIIERFYPLNTSDKIGLLQLLTPQEQKIIIENINANTLYELIYGLRGPNPLVTSSFANLYIIGILCTSHPPKLPQIKYIYEVFNQGGWGSKLLRDAEVKYPILKTITSIGILTSNGLFSGAIQPTGLFGQPLVPDTLELAPTASLFDNGPGPGGGPPPDLTGTVFDQGHTATASLFDNGPGPGPGGGPPPPPALTGTVFDQQGPTASLFGPDPSVGLLIGGGKKKKKTKRNRRKSNNKKSLLKRRK